jgi:hypothetical protein
MERLYNLLPAIYRIKDVEKGEPLNALMAVIERELQAIESDIDRLYDNWFIETCDEWVVPYIGDLLGVKGLQPLDTAIFSQRAYVANILAHRRRKGTALVLEQVARDITGWPAKAVEFYKVLATTQSLNHIRLSSPASINLVDGSQLEHLDGPFDVAAHTVDVRRISTDGGRYNIKNVGLFLWQMQSYPVTKGTARLFKKGRYWFNPLGYDMPLINRPKTEVEADHSIDEINVPGALRRRDVYEDMEAYRKSVSEGNDAFSIYLGDQPAFQIFLNGENGSLLSVLPEEILICNLSDWDDPWTAPESDLVKRHDGQTYEAKVAVDPELGRLAFLDKVNSGKVQVSYSYGFGCDIGGGPYNRRGSMDIWLQSLKGEDVWIRVVTQDQNLIENASNSPLLKTSLKDAIGEWNEYPKTSEGRSGIIILIDSDSYDLTSPRAVIKIPAKSKLAIISAAWPQVKVSENDASRMDFLVPEGLRPHLKGDIYIQATQATAPENAPGELLLNGLLIEGKLQVLVGSLGGLKMAHCTVAQDKVGIFAEDNPKLSIEIDHCICGPIKLADTVPSLRVSESIIDKGNNYESAIEAPGTDLDLEDCTIFGATRGRSLEASDCIFTGGVKIERQQTGCVRFCYLPGEKDLQTPRRYRCQPDLALVETDGVQAGGRQESDESIKARIAPVFRSLHYDYLGYGQLSPICAEEILKGAEDGSEMGAFGCLKLPQREANLRASLKEYLRLGLDAGIFQVRI